jgi:hypothetical protein
MSEQRPLVWKMTAPQIKFDDLPDFLQPKLRLFMSADLVGSTAFKQAPSYPLQIPSGEKLPGPRWLASITNFYSAFGAALARQWNEFVDLAGQEPWPTGPAPFFWKGIGDEVVYAKDLCNPKEVAGTVWVWKRALKKFRADLKSKIPALDIKSTVWIGGFPINNSEVVFDTDLSSAMALADDPQVSHFQKLQQYYRSNKDRNKYVLDFIGTSIDTGFRIATRATPRRMIASIETVLMIASEPIPNKKFGPLAIHFDGYDTFKGVLGGKPYPIFWIDLFDAHVEPGEGETSDQQLAVAEDKLESRQAADHTKLQQFCEAFIGRHAEHLIRPFVPECTEGTFQQPPPKYRETLQEWHEKIKKEQERDSAEKETEQPGGVEAPATNTPTLSPAEIEKRIDEAIEPKPAPPKRRSKAAKSNLMQGRKRSTRKKRARR